MSYEFEFEDQWFENGYGGVDGTLVVEVEPIFEDCSFDAYDGSGNLATYGQERSLIGVEVIGATFFAVGNNGEELGEYTFESLEDLAQFGIEEKTLIEELIKEGV